MYLQPHLPKALNIMYLAGLLTYPYPERLPVTETVAIDCSGVLKGLTAAGTISEFHTIPFSSFIKPVKN